MGVVTPLFNLFLVTKPLCFSIWKSFQNNHSFFFFGEPVIQQNVRVAQLHCSIWDQGTLD